MWPAVAAITDTAWLVPKPIGEVQLDRLAKVVAVGAASGYEAIADAAAVVVKENQTGSPDPALVSMFAIVNP